VLQPEETRDDPKPASLVTLVTVSNASAIFGEARVVLTADLAIDHAPDIVVAGGVVKFTIKSENAAAEDVVIATASSSEVSKGTATAILPLKDVPVGAFAIEATYEPHGSLFQTGDSSNAATLTVERAATRMRITSSDNPSIVKKEVTLTVVVASETSGTPTGTVDFFVGKDTKPSATATLKVVDGKSVATVTTAELRVDKFTINAAYSGDVNFSSSETSLAPLVQVVKPDSAAGAAAKKAAKPATAAK
jgi:large repetitive protein